MAAGAPPAVSASLVIDACLLVDLMVSEHLSEAVVARVDASTLHAPAHLDAEVLSALGRLQRAGDISATALRRHLGELAEAPIVRHPLPDLLVDAWAKRASLRLADALYVALAEHLSVTLVTTDARLARVVARADLVT